MPIGIDIFSGAGGLSLGAEMAGLEIPYAIEKDRNAATTYQRNHPDTQVLCDDIHDIDPLALNLLERPFIVFGGPPCQGFSTSNTKTRTLKNPNNSLFEEFVRFVSVLQPDWFLFENVSGIVSFEHGKTLQQIRSCFENLGYTLSSNKILMASDYGVPQNRNRFILVGNRNGVQFEFPTPYLPKISVEQAIGDLPLLDNGQMSEDLPYAQPLNRVNEYARLMRRGSRRATQNYVSRNEDYVIERYRYIRQGHNWRDIPDDLMQNYADKNNCHSGIYKRLDPTVPSIVISNYRKNMLIHPYQDRGLSVREAARLQSFPDTYVFCGSLMYIQQQIGNAVPPLLAKAVFEKILEYERE